MDKSNDINELAAALSKAQSKFLPIFKSLKVSYATSAGKKEYNYAPLSAVIDATKQALSDNGLAIIQPTEIKDNKLYINTVLCHSSGQWIESSMYVGESGQPPQAEGSALSYKRRYGLSAMLNIASEEDDDAQEAEAAGRGKPVTTPVKTKAKNDLWETTENKTPPAKPPQAPVAPVVKSEAKAEDNSELSTAAQRTAIFAAAKAVDMKNEQIKDIVQDKYKVESTKALTKVQAGELIEYINSYSIKEANNAKS